LLIRVIDMGLGDLLSVVFGVKTAEALQQRKAARQAVDEESAAFWAQMEQEKADSKAALAQRQADFEVTIAAFLDAMTPADRTPPDELAMGIFDAYGHPSSYGRGFFARYVPTIYAAYVAQGDPGVYQKALPDDDMKLFDSYVTWVARLRSTYGDPFINQLVDVCMDAPLGYCGERVQQIRANLGMPPLARLPQTKVCPACAETVKYRAAVCRFCGNEFNASTPGGISKS
jgi:hypothetical protein